MAGIELCEELASCSPDLPVIVITGQADVDTAIAAIRAGAYDFITKPVIAETPSVAVGRALEHHALRQRGAAPAPRPRPPPARSTASSATARRSAQVTELIRRVADSDATVLITGESGTGKELVARAHPRPVGRAQGRAVRRRSTAARCPANLLESELFGHVRGAFTDAKRDRARACSSRPARGTLFLDEIGEMPLDMQVKLLRVLQERTVRPVGGDDEIAVRRPHRHARPTAISRPRSRRSRFREDLFYRINVVAIDGAAAARARRRHPAARAALPRSASPRAASKPVTGISPEAARKLLDYDWPGNVRELENCIERAVALCRARRDHRRRSAGARSASTRARAARASTATTPPS